MPQSGLSVERHPSGRGWHVVHASSRAPLGFTVRLRAQAQAAAGDLYATGVDFTLPAGAPLRAHPKMGGGYRRGGPLEGTRAGLLPRRRALQPLHLRHGGPLFRRRETTEVLMPGHRQVISGYGGVVARALASLCLPAGSQ